MKTLHDRLSNRRSDEAGLSLIEVMVAMMIFAMVSVGLAAGMIAAMRMTDSARDRTTASNLAAEAIDRARTADVLEVTTGTETRIVDGTAFTIKSDVRWVGSEAGSVGQCSAGGGILQYKRVNVSVRWPGMLNPNRPVQADTQIAPNTRVNDPEKGVIVVSVRKASGAASPGVEVKAVVASPPNGATAIADRPLTDAQGCAYLYNVQPGNYVISVSKPSTVPVYTDNTQNEAPTLDATVSKGKSATPAFQFDQSARFTASFATNFAPVPAEAVTVPPTLEVSAANGYGIWLRSGAGPHRLHPYTAGYNFVAGRLATDKSSASACLSVDPTAWPVLTDASGSHAGTASPVAADPGAAKTANVPTGVVKISGLGGSWVRATSQATPPIGLDDPGCVLTSSYLFQLPAGASANVALPYGSWQLVSGSASVQNTPIPAASIAPRTRGVVTPGAAPVLTLDPRTLVAP